MHANSTDADSPTDSTTTSDSSSSDDDPPPPPTVTTSVDDDDPTTTTVNVGDVVTPVTDDQKAECAAALSGTVADVVAITGSQTVVSSSSIVAVSLSGSARFVMSAPIELRGFCLFQGGELGCPLHGQLGLRSSWVFLGGNPKATFVLADGASLTSFYATAGGGASIGIYAPQNLDCQAIQAGAVVNGNPTIDCGDREPGT